MVIDNNEDDFKSSKSNNFDIALAAGALIMLLIASIAVYLLQDQEAFQALFGKGYTLEDFAEGKFLARFVHINCFQYLLIMAKCVLIGYVAASVIKIQTIIPQWFPWAMGIITIAFTCYVLAEYVYTDLQPTGIPKKWQLVFRASNLLDALSRFLRTHDWRGLIPCLWCLCLGWLTGTLVPRRS